MAPFKIENFLNKAADLQGLYRRNRIEGRIQISNATQLLVLGESYVVPIRRVFAGLADKDMLEANSEGDDLSTHRAWLLASGFVELTDGDDKFEAAWHHYTSTCEKFRTAPSKGTPTPRSVRKFWVTP